MFIELSELTINYHC